MKKAVKKMFAGYVMAWRAYGGKKAVIKYLSGTGLLCGGLYLLLKGDQEMTSAILGDYFEKAVGHLDQESQEEVAKALELEMNKMTDEWG